MVAITLLTVCVFLLQYVFWITIHFLYQIKFFFFLFFFFFGNTQKLFLQMFYFSQIFRFSVYNFQSKLTFTTPWTNSADDKLIFFIIFFSPENRDWNFMQIVSNVQWRQFAWTVKSCFLEKNNKKFQIVVCWKFYQECCVKKFFGTITINDTITRIISLIMKLPMFSREASPLVFRLDFWPENKAPLMRQNDRNVWVLVTTYRNTYNVWNLMNRNSHLTQCIETCTFFWVKA